MSTNLSAFLTPKQQTFVNEYLVDMNATRAALRAGYSASTALNGQLMQMPKIKLYLQQHLASATAKAEFTHERVLRELGKIAFASTTDYFDGQGNFKPMHEINDDAKAALWSVTVSSFAVSSEGVNGEKQGCSVVKLRMYNKLAALDKIAKHIGFYEPDKQKKVQYVYLDKADMTEDDSFDDVVVDYTDEEDGRQRAEDGRLTAEDRGQMTYEDGGTDDGWQEADEDMDDGAKPVYGSRPVKPGVDVLVEREVMTNRITDEEREILMKQMPTFRMPGMVTNGYSYADIVAHEARVKEITARMKLYGLVV